MEAWEQENWAKFECTLCHKMKNSRLDKNPPTCNKGHVMIRTDKCSVIHCNNPALGTGKPCSYHHDIVSSWLKPMVWFNFKF